MALRDTHISTIIDLARGEASTSTAEHPRGSNRTKYGKWYGVDGVPWCAIGISWLINEAGLWFGIHGPRTAWVPDYRVWARARGRWSAGTSDVREGDIVCFRGGQHVEIVVRTSGNRFWTVGFNTSWRGKGGSFANGIYVAENERTHDTVDGTLHPFYGVTETMVKKAQELTGAKQDGDLGPVTMRNVKTWQDANGLTADGIPGEDTYAAMTSSAPTIPAIPAGGTSVPVVKPAPGPDLIEDGRLGHATVTAMQEWLNAEHDAGLIVDGKAGHSTWTALQHALGTPADGKVSNQSYRASELGNGITQGWDYDGRGASGSTMVGALQGRVGVKADKIWFEGTTAALQRHMNEGA